HRDPGRESRVHETAVAADPLGRHRAFARGDRTRQRPRPMVHRRTGTRVRHRRHGRRVARRTGAVRRGTADGTGTMSTYTIPNVIERTPAGERSFDVFSRLLNERIVFLGTEIDDGVANVVMAQMLHLEAESPDREIGLYIKSTSHLVSFLKQVSAAASWRKEAKFSP